MMDKLPDSLPDNWKNDMKSTPARDPEVPVDGWKGSPLWFEWKDGLGGCPTGAHELSWLSDVLREYDIESVNDVGVGIARPYREVCRDLDYVEYDKSDIDGVEKVDVRTEVLRKSDLIICRDVLPFMRYSHVERVLENFKVSGAKYLIVSEYVLLPKWVWKPKQSGEYGEPKVKYCQNDVRVCTKPGEWWPISFQHPPYSATPLSAIDRDWRCVPFELRATNSFSAMRMYSLDNVVVDPDFDLSPNDTNVWDFETMARVRTKDKTLENVEYKMADSLLEKHNEDPDE